MPPCPFRLIFVEFRAMTSVFRLLLPAVCLYALIDRAAYGQSANLTLTHANITKDNFVSDVSPTRNYGGTGSLAIADPTTAKGGFDSVIQYDITPAYTYFNSLYGVNQWDVLEVRLGFTMLMPNNALFNSPNLAGTLSIAHLANDVWSEGNGSPMTVNTTDFNFNGLSALTAGETVLSSFHISTVAPGTAYQFELALADSLTYYIKNGFLTSFHLSATEGGSYLFASRSNASGQPTMLISVQAVPEPSSVLLTVVGGSLLYYRRHTSARSTAAYNRLEGPKETQCY